jgi:hypothetical protein
MRDANKADVARQSWQSTNEHRLRDYRAQQILKSIHDEVHRHRVVQTLLYPARKAG